MVPATIDHFYSTDGVTDDITVDIEAHRHPSDTDGSAVTILFQHAGNSSWQLSLRLSDWEKISDHIADRLFEARRAFERA